MATYQRWVTLSFLGLGTVAWVLVRKLAGLVWDLAELPIPTGWPLPPSELFGLVVGVGTFVWFRRSARVNAFANEVAAELVKVTWAPRKETVVSTGVIAVVIGICTLILSLMDLVWGKLMKLFLYR